MRITGWRREVTWRMTRDEAQRVTEVLEAGAAFAEDGSVLDDPEVDRWAWDLRRQGDVAVSS
jgi:hypothetical protein